MNRNTASFASSPNHAASKYAENAVHAMHASAILQAHKASDRDDHDAVAVSVDSMSDLEALLGMTIDSLMPVSNQSALDIVKDAVADKPALLAA